MIKEGTFLSRFFTKTCIYVLCLILAVLSIFPFWIMVVNATRSSPEIQQGVSLWFSGFFGKNWNVIESRLSSGFNPFVGLRNSMIISTFATLFAVYFSSLTAYGIVAYNFRAKNALFTFIVAVMMIPAQVSSIGFYKFMYQIGGQNNLLAFIIPAIASPTVVFFMRQYLLASLSVEIVEAARIDGSSEFATFNRIVIPIMMPAVATQAIFVFVTSWNNLFMPMILLTKTELKTMPVMISLLRSDVYRVEFGAIYLALTIAVLPLFIIYFLLSRYIIAGVALGSVKE